MVLHGRLEHDRASHVAYCCVFSSLIALRFECVRSSGPPARLRRQPVLARCTGREALV